MADFSEFLNKNLLGKITWGEILWSVVFIAVCLLVMKIVSRIITKALEKSKIDQALSSFIRSITQIGLWVLVFLVVADKLGIPITSFVALLSVAGLALSLSLQNIMSNLFSGFTIIATKPFSAGDFVELGSTSGTVRNIGLFHTSITTVDNKHIFVPNSDITSSRIINYSTEPMRRVDVAFTLPYEYEARAVQAAAMEAAATQSSALPSPAPEVRIDGFEQGGVKYVLRLWVKTEDYWDVYYGLCEELIRILAARGLPMSCASSNVHIVS